MTRTSSAAHRRSHSCTSSSKKDPRNAERIFPYIGGEEVNADPEQKHRRYVINFGEFPLDEAGRWKDLLEIVEERVKPERDLDNRASYRNYWWQFAEKRGELATRLATVRSCFAVARVGQHAAFARLDSALVPSEQLVVFPVEEHSFFAVL